MSADMADDDRNKAVEALFGGPNPEGGAELSGLGPDELAEVREFVETERHYERKSGRGTSALHSGLETLGEVLAAERERREE